MPEIVLGLKRRVAKCWMGSIEFARKALGSLKRTQRAGWMQSMDRADVESVCDHSHGVALLAVLAGQETGALDTGKLTQMAVVHDISEAVVGDLTPHDGVSPEEKAKREDDAMQQLCALLPGERSRNELLDLWREYEHRRSEEAVLVGELDKVEMVLQADMYEQQLGHDLSNFFSSADKYVRNNGTARHWLNQVLREREQRMQAQV